MIVLSLSGSPYEMGYEHGRELKLLVKCQIRCQCRIFKQDVKSCQPKLRIIEKKMDERFPRIMEEIRGIADGAECALDDVLFYNFKPEIGGCSNLVFLGDDGPMLGHINDAPQSLLDGMFAFHARSESGKEVLYMGMPGSVSAGAGVNSHGLAVSFSSGRGAGLKNPEGFLSPSVLRRALLEECRDVQEAKSILSSNACAWAAENVIALDKSGDAFVAEKLATAMEFHYPENGALYCTNRYRTERISSLIEQEEYERVHADRVGMLARREAYFEELIGKNVDQLSFELMQEAFRCVEEGIEVCNKGSNWAAILFPTKFEMFVADRFPCDNPFERVVT